jgi:hypothetical protein
MPFVPIVAYAMKWNFRAKQAAVRIKLQTGEEIPIPVSNAEELTAVATILNESPVSFNTDNGDIATTSWEPVGGA